VQTVHTVRVGGGGGGDGGGGGGRSIARPLARVTRQLENQPRRTAGREHSSNEHNYAEWPNR